MGAYFFTYFFTNIETTIRAHIRPCTCLPGLRSSHSLRPDNLHRFIYLLNPCHDSNRICARISCQRIPRRMDERIPQRIAFTLRFYNGKIVLKGGERMKVYSPSDMALMLQLKPATLRKYSALLEQYGYEIGRNSQGHRYYRDEDIITLRNIIAGNDSGVSLEQSVQNVVSMDKDSSMTNDTNIGESANNSDIQELKNMIQEQSDMISKQNEVIGQLSDRLDKQSEQLSQQQEYIKTRLEERDQALLQSLDDKLESRKQIAAESQEDKRGFFARLFNKSE